MSPGDAVSPAGIHLQLWLAYLGAESQQQPGDAYRSHGTLLTATATSAAIYDIFIIASKKLPE